MHNEEKLGLFEELYIKYISRQSNGKIVSSRTKIVEEYENITGVALTKGQYDHRVSKLDREKLWELSRKNLPTRDTEEFGVTHDEGLYYSQRYIELSTEDKYTPTDILLAHGFHPDFFELAKASSTGSKIGTNANEEQYFINTYRNVQAVPKKYYVDYTRLNQLLKNIQPYKLQTKYKPNAKNMLLLTLYDTHFGINFVEDYAMTQARIHDQITTRHRSDIYFVFGQDMFHNDNLRGQTSSGTDIEAVNMNDAIESAIAFYDPLVRAALQHSNNVHLIYSMGNHDEMVGNMFTRLMHALYPQCKLDIRGEHPNVDVYVEDEYGEYKLLRYGNNSIGLTHGHWVGRRKERLHDVYMALFPDDFTMNHQRYIITGHHHTDRLQDQNGTSIYSLSTRAKSDKWHVKSGYVGSKKRFKIFEFDEYEMRGEWIV